METFGEEISAEACSSMGFTEEDNDNEYDDTKIVKTRVSEFSRGKLEAGRNGLGLCTARYESKSCC